MTFPTEAVDTYLRGHLSGVGSIRSTRKFDVGQSNPTFLVETDAGRFVLRAQPAGTLLQSAHAVDREFRVLRALERSGVPVPRAIHYCDDPSVMGNAFYLMEYVPGHVYLDPRLPGVSAGVRRRVYDSACGLLVALNSVDTAAVGLGDYGRPADYWRRQVRRWTEQYRASETQRRPDLEALIEGLPAALPDPDEQTSLVHGDFRLDNLIVDEQGEIRAVLDWELSTLGSPYADLAYQCAQWRLPESLRGFGDLDRRALGIPTEGEYVETYCSGRGLSGIPHWNCFLAVSLFRLAAICQGIFRRGLDGNASNLAALGFGDKVDTIAECALRILNEADPA